MFRLNQQPALIRHSKRIPPAITLALSFMIIIILGSVALWLPFSHYGHLSWLDAFFTATSATCVTGLIVVDTGEKFTLVGQWITILLVQIGGLGIMTFSVFFSYLFYGRLSIKSRNMIEHSLGIKGMPKLGHMLLFIVVGTFVFELIGALIMSVRFHHYFDWPRAIYLGVYHAISAFCNAGFCLFSNSFMDYQSDWVLNLVLLALIVLGGIGFWVLFDLRNFFIHNRGFRALSMHSRLVISTTLILIVTGFILIFLFEYSNTLAELSGPSKVLAALFQSITTRTAGFNSLNISTLTNSTLFLMLLLMMIGASPGSCGGGIKTTTSAVLFGIILSRIRDQRQIRLQNRGIPEMVVSKSIGIIAFWLLAVTVVILILLFTEHPGGLHDRSRVLFLQVLFESFSAMGTVGLSMGLTPVLSQVGKLCIIFLMFFGRVGPLSIAIAIATKKASRIRYAEDNLLVG
ncbi:Trk family potassium uptake protein [candidate division KSB1 bacterium]|nr:Trk family potassium uptake protein [candidate division KSB1 bacterium]